MVRKVVASLALAGSLAMGCAGAAVACTPNSTPNSGSSCTNEPALVARLQAQEAQVASRLASMQAMAAQGGPGASWLRFSIAFLTHAEAELASQVSNLQAQCPTLGGSGVIGVGLVG
jgi:hypothetical protein